MYGCVDVVVFSSVLNSSHAVFTANPRERDLRVGNRGAKKNEQ